MRPSLHRMRGEERVESQAAVRHQIERLPCGRLDEAVVRGGTGCAVRVVLCGLCGEGGPDDPGCLSCHFVNAPDTARVPGPPQQRRYLPAGPPSHGGRTRGAGIVAAGRLLRRLPRIPGRDAFV
ncbi:hypothetical protein GCM10010378_68670 [Streptomyces viridochromogenes]